jgi:hypothetical protein
MSDSMNLYLSICGLVLAIVFFAFASWRAMTPHNSLQPRIIPWKPMILVSGVIVVAFAFNLAAQLGFSGRPPTAMAP